MLSNSQFCKKGSAPRSWYKVLSYITRQKDIPFVRIDVLMVKVLSHVPLPNRVPAITEGIPWTVP